MGSSEEDLVRVETIMEDSTIFTLFTKEEGRWPFRIDNNADISIFFWQLDTKTTKYQVQPGKSKAYAWDNPSLPNKALVLHVNGREREIDVREIGQLMPFKYPVSSVEYFLVVFLICNHEKDTWWP
jgi:vacuolar protein sorting-associated protein 13A/C